MNIVVRKDKMLATTSIIVSEASSQFSLLRSVDQLPLVQVVIRCGAQEEAQAVPPG